MVYWIFWSANMDHNMMFWSANMSHENDQFSDTLDQSTRGGYRFANNWVNNTKELFVKKWIYGHRHGWPDSCFNVG